MLPADQVPSCPECESGPQLARRDFIRVLGTATATVAVGGITPLQKARAARAEKQAQAEAMVFELFKSMSDDQKKKLVRAWSHPTRLGTGNAAVDKLMLGELYDKKQVALLDKIFRAIANGEEGYKRLSRDGRFDGSNDFESISALIYGEPAEGKKFALVFTGHHITVRCDGNSEEKYAFGGPLYYGHSPKGTASNNVFNYQSKALDAVFEALSADQRKIALKDGKWADGVNSVKLPKKDAKVPGLVFADLTKEQKGLVETVMKEMVAPYRKEDGDEVMEIVKENGGMDKMSLAFYLDPGISDKHAWHYWRLEGPGVVWSFRTLPHVHTFVNISSKLS